MIEKIWVTSPEDISFKDCERVRREVFVQEQGVPEEIDFDGSDARALSLLYIREGQPIATGRLIQEADGLHIGRVAVVKAMRGKGIGAQLVNDLAERAFAHGAESCIVHAQLHAKDFYGSLGFSPKGEVFMEADIEHIKMVREA